MILTRMLRRIFGGNAAIAPASVPGMASSAAIDMPPLLPELITPAVDKLFNFFMPTFWEPRIPRRSLRQPKRWSASAAAATTLPTIF